MKGERIDYIAWGKLVCREFEGCQALAGVTTRGSGNSVYISRSETDWRISSGRQ